MTSPSSSVSSKEMMQKLRNDASQGADLSPGDPVAAWALGQIDRLQAEADSLREQCSSKQQQNNAQFQEIVSLKAKLRSAHEPEARCTDCLSGEISDGRIVHREGCSIVLQEVQAPPYGHGGRIMTLEECAEAEGARIEPKMDDETVILRRLLGAAQARIVELEGSYAHHITCNYQNGPIGGDGCICVVLNKHEQLLLAKIAHERSSPPPADVLADAERYRWLRETGNVLTPGVAKEIALECMRPDGEGFMAYAGAALDAYIDDRLTSTK